MYTVLFALLHKNLVLQMQQSINKLLFYDKMCWECYIWNAVILESPQSEVYSGGRMGGGVVYSAALEYHCRWFVVSKAI